MANNFNSISFWKQASPIDFESYKGELPIGPSDIPFENSDLKNANILKLISDSTVGLSSYDSRAVHPERFIKFISAPVVKPEPERFKAVALPQTEIIISKINDKTTPVEFEEYVKLVPTYEYTDGDSEGCTALMAASIQGNVELIRHIFNKAVAIYPNGFLIIDLVDEIGRTALYYTAQSNNFEKGYNAAKELLNLGASPNIKTFHDYNGIRCNKYRTPLKKALFHRNQKHKININLVTLLLKHNGICVPELQVRELHNDHKANKALLKAQKQIEEENSIIEYLQSEKVEDSFHQLPLLIRTIIKDLTISDEYNSELMKDKPILL